MKKKEFHDSTIVFLVNVGAVSFCIYFHIHIVSNNLLIYNFYYGN